MDKLLKTDKMLFAYHVIVYLAAIIPGLLYKPQYIWLILLIVAISAGLSLQIRLTAMQLMIVHIDHMTAAKNHFEELSRICNEQKNLSECMLNVANYVKDVSTALREFNEAITKLAADKPNVNVHKNDKKK